jgi:hypothetical protein
MKANSVKSPRAAAKSPDHGGSEHQQKSTQAAGHGGSEHEDGMAVATQDDKKSDPKRDPKKPGHQPPSKPSDSSTKPVPGRQSGQGKQNQQPNPSR